MVIEFVELGQVGPNPFQPRTTMEPAGVEVLAANILASAGSCPETLGMLQVPRGRRADDGRVQLAYGHRRLAAFRLLAGGGHSQYGRFPLELATLSDAEMAVIAWSENAVREDVSPMEEARFLRRIIDEFGWTGGQAAARLGMSVGTLSNTLRLVNLPAEIQEMVGDGAIPRARALALCSMMEHVDDAQLKRLADDAQWLASRAFKRRVMELRQEGVAGAEVLAQVVEPAAQVLAQALRDDQPGAWGIVARAIDLHAEAASADDLARLVIERAAQMARSASDGRKRINALYEPAGLVPPWNARATAMVSEFMAWRKQRRAA